MLFKKFAVSHPCHFIPGSCQAECLHTVLSRPILLATMTREESEFKQLRYERERAAWRKAHRAREAGPVAEELDPEG